MESVKNVEKLEKPHEVSEQNDKRIGYQSFR